MNNLIEIIRTNRNKTLRLTVRNGKVILNNCKVKQVLQNVLVVGRGKRDIHKTVDLRFNSKDIKKVELLNVGTSNWDKVYTQS